ncbi:MAG: PQQ-binding-like beta-propeller repeat protein [Terriglobia bacterium]
MKKAALQNLSAFASSWMIFLIFIGMLQANAYAVDWSQFRGPNSSGLAEDCVGLPSEFGPEKNQIWKTELPPGHSSPVLTKEYLFLTGHQERKLYVMGLSRTTGKILWQREVPKTRSEELHKANSPASPSPVTDAKNVYAFFTDFGLIAFTTQGKELWQLPLGPFNNPMGMGSSPILVDDMLILNCDQESGSFLLAVDKETGKIRWRVERPEFTRGFATPIVYEPRGGPRQILVAGSFQLTAYSAETGKELWWVGGMSWQMKGTPVMGNEMIFINGWAGGADEGQQENVPSFEEILKKEDTNHDGKLSKEEVSNEKLKQDWNSMDLDRDGYLTERDWRFYRLRRSVVNSVSAYRLGEHGDETDTHLVWRYRKSLPNVPSPLLYMNVLYLVKEGGIMTALDAATGAVYKQARLTNAPGDYFASPVAADGKIFAVSQEGKVSVIRPGKDWEVLTTNDLLEECFATPAFDEGRLYIRTRKAIYCFGKR